MSDKNLPSTIVHQPSTMLSTMLPHNRYHRAARSSAAMAIVYAAMAGRELIEARKKIKHGGWDTWIDKNCEFNRVTAWRYMDVAKQIGDKIQMFNALNISDGKAPSAALIKLLDRPPSELLPEETEKLLTDIRAATEGQTLRQLYFDFGLATPPKPVGGANHLHAFLKEHFPDHPEYLTMALRDLPKEVAKEWNKHIKDGLLSMEDRADGYRKTWGQLVQDLRHHGLDKKTYCFLSRDELERVYGTLIDLKKELSEALKK